MKNSGNPCSGKEFELANRFCGTWEEYTVSETGETLVGTLETTWELGGCVLTQRFTAADNSFAFIAFGYLDSENGAWQETYILDIGRVAHYRWEPRGDEIFVHRLGGNRGDLRRLRIQNLTPGSYDVLEERSRDGGAHWDVVEVTRTRRVT